MSKYRNEQNPLVKQSLGLPLNKKIYYKNIYPCNLGIFFSSKTSPSILDKLKFQIEFVFDSFFFDIIFIGEKKLTGCIQNSDAKEEFNFLDKSLRKVVLYPTNVFYSTIKNQMPENNLAIGLGLTNLPIYSSSDERLLFLFGEANLKHNCAIVSTHNLKELHKSETAENRIIKEGIHEIGHLILGLEHCMNDSCVMWFSANVKEIDRKSNKLCEKCRLELEEIRIINNF